MEQLDCYFVLIRSYPQCIPWYGGGGSTTGRMWLMVKLSAEQNRFEIMMKKEEAKAQNTVFER